METNNKTFEVNKPGELALPDFKTYYKYSFFQFIDI